MKDPLETKYAALKDPGIRAFMIAGERFHPANAVSFTLSEQRDFYDLYCAHFRKPRPENIAVKDFAVGPVICRLNGPKPSKDLPVMTYVRGGGLPSSWPLASIPYVTTAKIMPTNYMAQIYPCMFAVNPFWCMPSCVPGI